MINLKRSPNSSQHNFMIVLPLMILACFAVYASHAGILNKTISSSTQQLAGFEGYYQSDKDKNIYLQIMVKNNQLILKQLWDEVEIPFEQKSALYFYNEQHSFPLTFSKDANGEITQVLAFERDTSMA